MKIKYPTGPQLRALGILENEELFIPAMIGEEKYLGKEKQVVVRKILDPATGRLSLAIMVDSETKQKYIIEDAWSEIEDEKRSLVQYQGRDLVDYLAYILELRQKKIYCSFYKNDFKPENTFDEKLLGYDITYSRANYYQLMRDINFDALVFVNRITKDDENRSKLARNLLLNLLRLFNYGDDDYSIPLIEDSVEIVKKGNCPWDIRKGPINISQLKSKIKHLEKTILSTTKYSNSRLLVLQLLGHFLTWSDWLDAETLLKNSYPKAHKLYKHRYDARTREIIQVIHEQSPIQDLNKEN